MNDRVTYVAQEGGDHYQTEYQHWDWVIEAEIGYLAGNATKYVSRWRKKNGIADLMKAMTYVEKMIATRPGSSGHYRPSRWRTAMATNRFVDSAKLTAKEADFVHLLSGPCPPEMLELARSKLKEIIADAQRDLQAQQRVPGATIPPTATRRYSAAHASAEGMENPFGYNAAQELGVSTFNGIDLIIEKEGTLVVTRTGEVVPVTEGYLHLSHLGYHLTQETYDKVKKRMQQDGSKEV